MYYNIDTVTFKVESTLGTRVGAAAGKDGLGTNNVAYFYSILLHTGT